MLCGRVCYFIPASKKKKQSNFRHTDKKPKRGKKGKRIFHVSLQMLGIFVLFLGFVAVAVVVVFMYCDKLRILSRLFLSFPLTTRDLIFFEFIFFLSFYYHFGIEENLDANARGQRRTCDTQLLTHLPLLSSAE